MPASPSVAPASAVRTGTERPPVAGSSAILIPTRALAGRRRSDRKPGRERGPGADVGVDEPGTGQAPARQRGGGEDDPRQRRHTHSEHERVEGHSRIGLGQAGDVDGQKR